MMFLHRWRVGTVALFLVGAAMAPGQDKPAPPADDLPTGAVLRLGTARFRHGSREPRGLAFLPDGKTLLTVGEGKNAVRLWDLATGQLVRVISTGMDAVGVVALSPDGTRLAVSGRFPSDQPGPIQHAVHVLELSTGKLLAGFVRSQLDGTCELAFTPDGQFLASFGINCLLRIEDVAKGVEVVRQSFGEFGQIREPRLAMSADGVTLALNGSRKRENLLLWNWKTRKQLHELHVLEESVGHFHFSPDGKHLVTNMERNGQLWVWDVAKGQVLRMLNRPGVKYPRNGRLVFSPDGKTMATPSADTTQDGKVELWDFANNRLRVELDCGPRRIGRMAFSADSRFLAVTTEVEVRIWDLSTDKELVNHEAGHGGLVEQVAFSPHGLIATASEDHTARIWDATTGRQIHKLSHGYWVMAIAFSPDGGLLATCSLDDTIRLWDVQTGRQLRQMVGHGKTSRGRFLSFSADGKRLLSFGPDLHLRVWNVADGKRLFDHSLQPQGVNLPAMKGPPRVFFLMWVRAASSSDGKTFVVGVPRSYHVFDVATGKELRNFPQEGGNLISLAVSQDGKRMLASAQGKQVPIVRPDGRESTSHEPQHPVCLYDLDSGKLLRQIRLPDGLGAGPAAFSPDGKRIAVAPTKPGVAIRFWDVESGKELPPLIGLRDYVHSLAFSPDGKHLAAALRDASVLVWDLTRKR